MPAKTATAPKPDEASTDKAQLDRFKQTARELGCDETGETFEQAFAKAMPPKRPLPSSKEPGSR